MDDFAIHYARTKSGDNVAVGVVGQGPPIVVLPGSLAISDFQNAGFAETLTKELSGDHTLAFYDHLGAGLSDRETYDYSPAGLLDELEAVIESLPWETCALFGVSANVPTSVRFAVAHPGRVTWLALMGWARGADYTNGRRFSAYRRGLEGDWEMASESFARVMVSLSGDEAEDFASFVRGATSHSAYIDYLDALPENDVTELLSSVAVPALVLQLTDGLFYPVELGKALAGGIPGAQLAFLTQGALFEQNQLILSFAREHSSGSTIAEGDRNLATAFQTLMFTDLESSTALTQRLGDEAAQGILHGHNDAVRKSLEEHGGREVKHTGDGIMAAFPSAVRAVEAALQIQRDLAGGEVRVRIGLNAGEPIAEDDDFFGTAVQLAARICDRAEPGQVLVSRVVADLCAGKKLSFQSAGEAHMRGFDEPVALFEVGAPKPVL